MKEQVIIIVQARMSSSRLPGKVMLPVLGKSLLARMVERLMMIRHSARIVIATSTDVQDDVIETEANELKIACYRGSLDNVLDRHYQAAKIHNADLVLKIPSDCPLIDPQVIDQVLDFYFSHKDKYDFISNLHPATWPDGNDVELMTMVCLQKAWENSTRTLELEHTTPYIWENPQVFRIANVLWETGMDYSMSHRFTIDYPEDYEFIKRVYEELYRTNHSFSCRDILELLEQKPEIYQLNAKYAGVNWYRHHLDELKTITPEQTRQLLQKIA